MLVGHRDNHARVKQINTRLKQAGLRTWLDAERMDGDIAQAMTRAIDKSAVVVCFVTQNYMRKVGGQGPKGLGDSCKLEFDYSRNRKGVECMVTVVMEARCRNTREWDGPVGGYLGGRLYIDLTDDSAEAFAAGVRGLIEQIRKRVGESGNRGRGNRPHFPDSCSTAPSSPDLSRRAPSRAPSRSPAPSAAAGRSGPLNVAGQGDVSVDEQDARNNLRRASGRLLEGTLPRPSSSGPQQLLVVPARAPRGTEPGLSVSWAARPGRGCGRGRGRGRVHV